MNIKQINKFFDSKDFLNDDWQEKVSLWWLKFRLSYKVKRHIVEKISNRIDNGGTLFSELASLTKIYEKQRPKAMETKFLRCIYERYLEKPSLSYALKPFYNNKILTILAAGDESGKLAEALRLSSDIMEKEVRMKAAAKIGYVAPIVAYALIVGAAAFAHFKLFKIITHSLPKSQLSPQFLATADTVALIVNTSWLTGLVVLAYLVYSIWSVPNQINNRPSRLPPWSTSDSANSAIVLKIFATLLRAGMPASHALNTIAMHSDPYVSHWCKQIVNRMVTGMKMGPSFACDFFQKEPRIEVEAYAESEDFDKKLDIIADDVFLTTELMIAKMTKMMTTVCMLAVSGMSVYLVLAVQSLGGGAN